MLTALVAFPASARAVGTNEVDVFFYQRYESSWTGVTDTFEYCIEGEYAGQPLPLPIYDSDRIEYDSQGRPVRFYFTMKANESAQDNRREFLISGLDEWATRSL